MAPPNLDVLSIDDPSALAKVSAIEPAVRRYLLRARAEHLALDQPELALSLLETLGEPACALKVSLLCGLGRHDAAVSALAEARRCSGASERGRISVAAATLARRRNQPKEAHRLLQEGLRFAEQPEVRGAALTRLGVLEIDRGATAAGLRALGEAIALLDGCGAVRLAASARVEEGLYRLILGEPEIGGGLLSRAAEDAERAGVVYLERIARTGLSLALRLLGEDRAAEAQHDRARALRSERSEEPGVFAIAAMERKLAGDKEGAQGAVQEGLERHEARPNPSDAAVLLALRASWQRGPLPQLPRETPPFARALLHVARGDSAGLALSRRIQQSLPDRLVAVFTPR